MITLSFPFQADGEQLIRKTLLEDRGIIVYPTETFYALGCAATDSIAVDSIYRLKGRSHRLPLLVLVNSWDMLNRYAEGIDETTMKVLNQYWPGPLTAVLKCKDNLAGELNSGGTTLGFRMTSSAVARELIKLIDLPLVGTSANHSSQTETNSCEKARDIFDDKVDIYIDGGTTPGKLPSTVVDFTGESPRVIRRGMVHFGHSGPDSMNFQSSQE